MSQQFLIDDLKREVVLRPDDARARFQLAEALFGDGQYTAAIKQLEKAIALDPDDLNARRLLARSYERDGREQEAVKSLEEMVRRHPDDLGARDELTELLMAQGRIDDALLQATHAARSEPHNPRRYVTIAELARMKLLHDRAREALEEAQRLSPEDPQIATMLRELYLDLGDEAASERMAGEKSRTYYIAQTKKAFQDKSAHSVRAKLPSGLQAAADALAMGDAASAKRALVACSPEDRESAGFELMRGEIFLIDGDLDRAEKHLRAAVAIDGGVGLAWNRLGDIVQSRGRLREAVGLYERAVACAPEDANAWEDLGDLHATLGDKARAAEMYQKAEALDPRGKAREKRESLSSSKKTGAFGDDQPRVGRIGVLGWTPRGGAVSPLEAAAIIGKGDLIFSGNVGQVGREAGQVAFSCLKARARELGIEELVGKNDLHLHFTDTEFGKDGPSSGLALVLAGVSAYTNRALRPRLAATGEITIYGEVKPVGGIYEKIVAAHLAGVRTVFLPRRNLRDGRDLPDEVAAEVELIYVDSVAEAIGKAMHSGGDADWR